MDGVAADKQPSPALRTGIVDPKQFSNDKYDCNDPLVPNNANELRWMQQHGYPTKEEQERLGRLSDSELGMQVRQGKLIAMTELGSRMIGKGDKKGLSLYTAAANRGSIYAYYLNADAAMKTTGFGSGPIESGAFLRLAILLGGHKAIDVFYRFAEDRHLQMAELRAIDQRAAWLYQIYTKNRQPTPRPQ